MSIDDWARACALTDHWLGDSRVGPYPDDMQLLFSTGRCQEAAEEICRWPGYAPSPLHSLVPLAKALDIGEIRYQDESRRFGLNSFKALGGAYAVLRYLGERLGTSMTDIRAGQTRAEAASLTVATATDGNHGRSVAWGAGLAGCRCKIFIHRHVSPGREQAMAALGAEVIRIDGDYDTSVRLCAEEAAGHGWQVISDTSYPGYDNVPRDVMAGYALMAAEFLAGMPEPPSHLILQVGVGGMAAAVAARCWMQLGAARPKIVAVEADRAACLTASLRQGTPSPVTVTEETVMAGLSCGEVSEVAYAILRQMVDAAVTIPDEQVAPTMRLMARGDLGTSPIEAGECAVPGLIALAAMARDPELRQRLDLTAQSRVLTIGCEGATDPDLYRQLIENH